MSYILSNLIQDSIKFLGQDAFDIRVATGGSTTMLEDTTLTDKYSAEDLLNGTVVVVSAGAAAPEGQFELITAYDESTQQFTINAMTAGIGSGDTCMLIPPDYPLSTLIEFANDSLRDCGRISTYSDSLITIVANKLEYTLANPNVLNVYLSDTKSSPERTFTKISGWKVLRPETGNSSLLLEEPYPTAGQIIRVEYEQFPTRVETYDDEIPGEIAPVLISLVMADKLMKWHGITDANVNDANRILADLKEARAMYPICKTPRPAKFLTWAD